MITEEIKRTYFKSEEEILWSGKPETLKYFSRTDICLIPITLIAGWFLLSYAYASFVMMLRGESVTFALSGITVLLITFYLLFGRIWYRYKRLSRNLYFVTSERILVFNTLRDICTVQLPLEEVSPVSFKNVLFLSDKHLAGDIIYGLGLDIFLHNMTAETPAFYAISDPQKVSNIIQKAKKSKKKNSRKDSKDDSDFI